MEDDSTPISDEEMNKFVADVKTLAISKNTYLTDKGEISARSYAKRSDVTPDANVFFRRYGAKKEYFGKNAGGGRGKKSTRKSKKSSRRSRKH